MKSTEDKSRVRKQKIQLRENQKKEDPPARNVRNVAKCYVFPRICVSSDGSKRRLAKPAGAEVAAPGFEVTPDVH